MLKINKNPDELILEWVVRMPNHISDEILVEMTAYEMTQKLEKKRKSGRHGWFGPNCSNRLLKQILSENMAKGDMIDVINLAAMIHARKKLFGTTA